MSVMSVGRLVGSCGLIIAACVTTPAFAGGDVRLADAIQHQDVVLARALLKQRVDVNASHPDGATALQWAAHWGAIDLADLLIRAGANVNKANDYGVAPIFLAAANGDAAMVDRLLSAGANANATLPSGETALMTAARSGSLAAVKALLARGANVNAVHTWSGQTALMWAAAENHADVAAALLERGVDIHTRSNGGQSTYWSCGSCPVEFKGGFTALLFAARKGALDTMKVLVTHGADVGDTAPDGSSALLLSTIFGHIPVAEFLLDRGADPNANGAGYTVLHWAAGSWEASFRFRDNTTSSEWYPLVGLKGASKVAFIRTLLAHGADPSARTTKNIPRHGTTGASADLPNLYEALVDATPFLLAAMASHADAMRLLAEAGADPLHAVKGNMTPLMMAAGLGWIGDEVVINEDAALEAVKVALQYGGDVNAVADWGDTALHAAAATAMPKVFQLLVANGADINVKNMDDETPLVIADGNGVHRGGVKWSSAEIAAYLRKLGAEEGGLDTAHFQTRMRYSDLICERTAGSKVSCGAGVAGSDDSKKAIEELRKADSRLKK